LRHASRRLPAVPQPVLARRLGRPPPDAGVGGGGAVAPSPPRLPQCDPAARAGGPLYVLRAHRSGLVRLWLGDPAPRDRLPDRLPLPALRPAALSAPAAPGPGHLAVPLAGLPDHAGRGSDQDPRRRVLARPDLSLLPLRDAADPESAEPLPAFHAQVVPQ